MKQMVICQRCQSDDKEIPMIGTMAFSGAEFWCPYCGNATGMFGEIAEVDFTKALEDVYDTYRAHAKRYLSAKGDLSCCAKMINGKRVDRKDFPSEIVEQAESIAAEGWICGRSVKELKNIDPI